MAIIIDTITGETISQSFTSTQQECSYRSLLADTTTISPSEYDRGLIEYYLLNSSNEYVKIGQTSKGLSFYYDFCSAGEYTVKQVLTIREIPNCGGTSPIIYQSDVVNNVEILEYKPSLALPGIRTCLIRDVEQTLSFVFELNSNVCGGLEDELVIEVLEKPKGSVITGIRETTFGSPYDWVITFDKIGVYYVKVTVQNCCYATVDYLTINVCEPLQIKPDCCTCGVFNLQNFSPITISYKINQLYPEVNTFTAIEGEVEGNKEVAIEVETDGIFEIRYVDTDEIEKTKLWYVFCLIDNCMNNLLKNILCSGDCCSDCPGEVRLKDREKLNKITLLAQLYYKWIDDEMDGLTYPLYPDNRLLDYNNRLKELYKIDDIYNKILEICSNCTGNASTDCGCGCS